MTDQAANQAVEFAELISEIRGMRADIASLEREQVALKAEFRNELKALRGDLAVTSHAQNEAITANKKKLTGWKRWSVCSTGD